MWQFDTRSPSLVSTHLCVGEFQGNSPPRRLGFLFRRMCFVMSAAICSGSHTSESWHGGVRSKHPTSPLCFYSGQLLWRYFPIWNPGDRQIVLHHPLKVGGLRTGQQPESTKALCQFVLASQTPVCHLTDKAVHSTTVSFSEPSLGS